MGEDTDEGGGDDEDSQCGQLSRQRSHGEKIGGQDVIAAYRAQYHHGQPGDDATEQRDDDDGGIEGEERQAVIGQQVSSRISVTREEIQKYYDEHKDDFVRSEGIRLAEILISNESATTEAALAEVEKEARDVHARVARGERFDEMARRFSDSEASKEQGGDIGSFRRGDLQKEIEDKVFAASANPGYVTDLIPVTRGWLILKVTDRRREGLAELEEVEQEIRNILMAPRYQPAIREYLASLREDAYIEIRPGYVDTNAVEGKDTSWSDPAKLAPVTTTRDELLNKKKKKKLLWLIPLGGGGDEESVDEPATAVPATEE